MEMLVSFTILVVVFTFNIACNHAQELPKVRLVGTPGSDISGLSPGGTYAKTKYPWDPWKTGYMPFEQYSDFIQEVYNSQAQKPPAEAEDPVSKHVGLGLNGWGRVPRVAKFSHYRGLPRVRHPPIRPPRLPHGRSPPKVWSPPVRAPPKKSPPVWKSPPRPVWARPPPPPVWNSPPRPVWARPPPPPSWTHWTPPPPVWARPPPPPPSWTHWTPPPPVWSRSPPPPSWTHWTPPPPVWTQPPPQTVEPPTIQPPSVLSPLPAVDPPLDPLTPTLSPSREPTSETEPPSPASDIPANSPGWEESPTEPPTVMSSGGESKS